MRFNHPQTIYRHRILDHYKNPRNWGTFKNYDCKAEVDNPLCGDAIVVYLKFDREKKIKAIKFFGQGCAVSIASASMLSEKLISLPLSAVKKMSETYILNLLKIKLSPIRLKCAMLGLLAVKKCFRF